MSSSELRGLVDATPAPDLPRLIGDLEAAKAAAWARLATVGAEAAVEESDTDARNLDVAEAAKRLGISRDWLYRNASRLPFAVRIGRRLVFDSAALERWNRARSAR